MFPWSPDFICDAAHMIFLGALYCRDRRRGRHARRSLRSACRRRAPRPTRSSGTRSSRSCPPAARGCRHELTGELPAAPARTASTAAGARRTRRFPVRGCASERLRSRPLGLSPAARPPLPPRAHLGAPRGRRHRHASVSTTSAAASSGTPDLVDLPAAGASADGQRNRLPHAGRAAATSESSRRSTARSSRRGAREPTGSSA